MNLNGYPCVISLWYTIKNGKIYCATKKNAKIVKTLQNNHVCGFEIAGDKPPYRGIRGDGNVSINFQIGKDILNILIKKYLGGEESHLAKFLLDNSHNEIGLEITPRQIFHYDYSKRMSDIREW
jgi:hypothetical protein